MADALLRLETVRERTGLSRSTLYALVARGEFPRQVNLGARSVGWIQSEVEGWIQERIRAARRIPVGQVA
jgi:prophage regulatory protein